LDLDRLEADRVDIDEVVVCFVVAVFCRVAVGEQEVLSGKERIESLTDDLAAAAYASLEPSELDQLIADLEPISAALDAAGSR
jgi:hypothetical protein